MTIKSIIIYLSAAVIGFFIFPVVCSYAVHAELFNFDFSGVRPESRFIMAFFTIMCFVFFILSAQHITGEQK